LLFKSCNFFIYRLNLVPLMNCHDVIVIGAGAIGSYVASQLAQYGLKVLLVDKKELPGKKICAGVISTDAFEEFSLPKGSIIGILDKIKVYSPLGTSIEYKHPKPLAYIVNRPSFDMALFSKALNSGAKFIGNFKVKGAKSSNSYIEVLGKDKHEKARVAVVACGFNPLLMKSLGFGSYPSFVEAIQTTVYSSHIENAEIHLGREIAPGAFAWILPIKNRLARIGLITRKDARKYLRNFLDRDIIKERIIENHQPVMASYLPAGPLESTVADRMLVVGEAAGQVKTTTYGGIYYGLLCAKEAIPVLIKAFETGEFGLSSLLRYEKKWREKIFDEIKIGIELNKKVQHIKDEEIEEIMRMVKKSKFLFLIKNTARFDWHKEIISLAIKKKIFSLKG